MCLSAKFAPLLHIKNHMFLPVLSPSTFYISEERKTEIKILFTFSKKKRGKDE